jgi:hypothetical protein
VPRERGAHVRIVDRRSEPVERDLDADLRAEGAHAAHVGRTRFVFADDDDDEPGSDPALAKECRASNETVAQLGRERATVEDAGRHRPTCTRRTCAGPARAHARRATTLETVRRETNIGESFTAEAFADAFAAFRRTYNVAPLRALCAPDVFARYCTLFERDAGAAHRHSTRARYEGVPLVTAVLAPGIVAFEGEVDEDRMGDW